jgi:hypothetical protein
LGTWLSWRRISNQKLLRIKTKLHSFKSGQGWIGRKGRSVSLEQLWNNLWGTEGYFGSGTVWLKKEIFRIANAP